MSGPTSRTPPPVHRDVKLADASAAGSQARQRRRILDRVDGIPAACSAVTADSRPLPGPFTHFHLHHAELLGRNRGLPPKRGKGRALLRVPLNPTVPAEAQHSTSPFVSVMVTIVLLNVALMCK